MKRVLEALSTVHAANDGTTVLIPTLLPIAIQLFHVDYVQLGILVAAGYVVNVVVQPLVGKYSERVEAGTLLVFGIGVMAGSAIILAFSSTYSSLLLGAVVLRIGSSFYHPIGPSVISKTYSGVKVDKIMGIASGFGDLGSFFIFLTASLLYSAFGWKFPFVIFAILDLIVATIALKYLTGISADHDKEILSSTVKISSAREEISNYSSSEIRDVILSKPPHRLPLVILFAGTLVTGGGYAIVLNFANSLMAGVYHSFLLANLPVSLWLMSFIVADFLTGIFSRRIGRSRLLLIAYAVSGVSTVLFSLVYGNIVGASLALVANGFMLSFTGPLIYSEIGTRNSFGGTKGPSLGTLFGLLFSIQVIGSALFSYLGGEISQFLNPVLPFEIIAGVLFAVAVVMAWKRYF